MMSFDFRGATQQGKTQNLLRRSTLERDLPTDLVSTWCAALCECSIIAVASENINRVVHLCR
jgi:hypothetical protein